MIRPLSGDNVPHCRLTDARRLKQVCERHALAKIRTCGCFTSPLRYNLTDARTARGAQKNGAESSVWQERGDDHKGTPPISVVLPSRRERPPNKAGSTVPTRVQNILGRPESGQGKPLHPRTCPPTGPTAVRSKPRNISTSTHPPSGSRIYPMRLRISPWLWFRSPGAPSCLSTLPRHARYRWIRADADPDCKR